MTNRERKEKIRELLVDFWHALRGTDSSLEYEQQRASRDRALEIRGEILSEIESALPDPPSAKKPAKRKETKR